ncbi:MAG: hypothetical protein MJZ31_07625 [Bacteroidales bacterium]|nr:hypothetical protein [Bacteroidales bacterium]
MVAIVLLIIGLAGGYFFASFTNKDQLKKLESMQKEITSLLSENEKIRSQAKESTRKAEDLESELSRIKRQNRNDEEKSEDLKDDLADANKKIKKLESHISILESEISDWKAACCSKDAEIEQLKNSLDKIQ